MLFTVPDPSGKQGYPDSEKGVASVVPSTLSDNFPGVSLFVNRYLWGPAEPGLSGGYVVLCHHEVDLFEEDGGVHRDLPGSPRGPRDPLSRPVLRSRFRNF